MTSHLVSFQFAFPFFTFSLLLECQDNQSNKDVQKEECEYNDEEDEEQCDLNLIVEQWSTINARGVYCIEHYTKNEFTKLG